MIDKNLVKRIMKSVTRREVGLSDHQIMHPIREWFLGLAIASIFLIVAVFLCVKLYWYYNSLELGQSSDSDTSVVIYRAEEIEAALTEFSARKEAYDKLKTSLANKVEKTPMEIPVMTDPINLPPPTPEEAPVETIDEVSFETPRPELGGQ